MADDKKFEEDMAKIEDLVGDPLEDFERDLARALLSRGSNPEVIASIILDIRVKLEAENVVPPRPEDDDHGVSGGPE